MLAGRLISRFEGGALACGQACLVGRHQGALDGPDADVVEVQAVAVAGLQGLDEEMVQGDLGEQLVPLLGGLVPSALTEPLTPFLRCMSGTNQRQSRCAALSGDIGDAVHCTIYENRPSPCREFAMSGENGEENDACNRARARYGLPPLRPLYKDIPALTGAESATTEGFAVQSPAS